MEVCCIDQSVFKKSVFTKVPGRQKKQNIIHIYPNPAAGGSVFIEMELNLPQKVLVELHDVGGQKIYSSAVFYKNGKRVSAIPLKELSPGIYFIGVQCLTETFNKKIIVL